MGQQQKLSEVAKEAREHRVIPNQVKSNQTKRTSYL